MMGREDLSEFHGTFDEGISLETTMAAADENIESIQGCGKSKMWR